MSHYRKIGMLVVVILLLASCVPPTPTVTPDPNTWPSWTLLIYLNGDNNLEGDALDDFLEMAEVGSNKRLNIVVQLDRHPDYDDGYGDWDQAKRFVVRAGDTPSSAALADLGEVDMGDEQVLENFIVWGVTNFVTDHYMLVIWNHGGGWRFEQPRLVAVEAARAAQGASVTGFKGVSWDETDADDFLYMHEVGTALQNAEQQTQQKLDIIGFDACLMGMLEVAYELRQNADFMVASEETEPGSGWPYDSILNELATNYPVRTPRKLATTIVQRYGDSYGTKGDETLAAYDLAQIAGVSTPLTAFIDVHNQLDENNKEWAAIGTARLSMEQFHAGCGTGGSCWGVDLGDLAKEIGSRVENDDLQEALLAIMLGTGVSLDKFVIANFHGDDHSEASGVAIYFPTTLQTFNNDPEHTGYQDTNEDNPVQFVQDFHWDNWLQEKYYQQFTGD